MKLRRNENRRGIEGRSGRESRGSHAVGFR